MSFNKQAKLKPSDVICDYMFVSHAHEDHFSDALKIAEINHPMLVAIPEIINLFPAGYDNVHGMNLGGSAHFPSVRSPWFRLCTVQAWQAVLPAAS